MLGLGSTILSPYIASEAGYANSHSVALDGSGDFFDTNTTLQTQIRNSFTISAWIKLDDGQPSAVQYIAGASKSANIFGFAVQTTGKLSVVHQANADIALYNVDAATFSDGATDWTHVAVKVTETGGNTAYNVYVNGSEVAGTLLFEVSISNHNNYTSDINLGFGGLQNGAGSATTPIDGFIDECAFFDAALEDSEISAIGGGGAPTDIPGHDHLHLYYKMNNSTDDEAGNSNGTLRADAAFSTTTP